MALTATIYKISLSIADMNRNYFADHALTMARHPSETEERLAVRMLAYALHAQERLEFGKGLSAEDEAAVWCKDLVGNINLWIDVGQPDSKRIRKACGRANQVAVYNYGGRQPDLWWQQAQTDLADRDNLSVFILGADGTSAMAALLQRTMTLHITIQEDTIWVNDGKSSVEITLTPRKRSDV